MGLAERKAWIGLLSLCPAYLLYFAIIMAMPDSLDSMAGRIAVLGVVATLHAVLAIIGTLLFAQSRLKDGLAEDERDRAIDGRATRIAYYILISGMILVGCVMPFSADRWALVNMALLSIVLAEGLRQLLIILGYRASRFAF